jgi:outer membrane protein assembly factor BamB
MPGVVFASSVDGHFRAYSTTDGKVLWDVDTAQEFKTVNGVSARGGSIDVAGRDRERCRRHDVWLRPVGREQGKCPAGLFGRRQIVGTWNLRICGFKDLRI